MYNHSNVCIFKSSYYTVHGDEAGLRLQEAWAELTLNCPLIVCGEI